MNDQSMVILGSAFQRAPILAELEGMEYRLVSLVYSMISEDGVINVYCAADDWDATEAARAVKLLARHQERIAALERELQAMHEQAGKAAGFEQHEQELRERVAELERTAARHERRADQLERENADLAANLEVWKSGHEPGQLTDANATRMGAAPLPPYAPQGPIDWDGLDNVAPAQGQPFEERRAGATEDTGARRRADDATAENLALLAEWYEGGGTGECPFCHEGAYANRTASSAHLRRKHQAVWSAFQSQRSGATVVE